MTIIKKIIHFFKALGNLFLAAGNGFIDDKVTKLSASLAYYTIFSLTPLIMIIISAASLFFGDKLDPDTQLFADANLSGRSTIGLIIGIVTLVIGSTAIFVEIQDSINLIWKVKAIPKKK